MSLEIGVKVNTREVKDARRDVEVLDRSLHKLREQEKVELGITGKDDLADSAAILVRIRDEVTRMGTISRSAAAKGGIIPRRELEEAQALTKRVQEGFSKWNGEIEKARTSLRNLAEERKDLQYTISSVMSGRENLPGHVLDATSQRLQAIDAEERVARARMGRLDAQNLQVESIRDRASRYSDVIEGSEAKQDGGSSLKRTLGWALAAAGGFSLMGFLSQARGTYQQYVGHEDTLYARGVRDIKAGGDQASAFGIDPMEHYALQEQLTRSMGLSGKGLGRMGRGSEIFAKAFGMNLSEVGGFGASVYQATGSRDGLPAQALVALQQAGIEKTRMPEMMRLVEGHLRTMSEARKGAALTDSNVATALALATAAMRSDSPETSAYLKSNNLASTLQNGLQGAGSPAGEISIFNAIGGFKGPMTFSKIHDMNLLRQGGFMERPDLFMKLMGNMPQGLDQSGKAGWLESMYPNWAKGKTADQLVRLYESGALATMAAGKLGGNSSGAEAEMLKQIGENPALSKQVRMAQKTGVRTSTGEIIDKLIDPIESKILGGSKEILDSGLGNALQDIIQKVGDGTSGLKHSVGRQWDRTQLSAKDKGTSYYQAVMAASKATGIRPELIFSIIDSESGGNPRALSKMGAKGLMQLMPGTAKAYGVKDPYDPAQNVMGGARYLAELNRQYGGDVGEMLAAYNGRGKATPGYVAKVSADYLTRTGTTMLPEEAKYRHDNQSVGERLKDDVKGLGETTIAGVVGLGASVLKLLERIAEALEHPAVAPAKATAVR